MIPCDALPQGHSLSDHAPGSPTNRRRRAATLEAIAQAYRAPIFLGSRPPADQPPPIPSDRPAIWELVIDDMRNRDHVGRERYGTPLQAHNGRDALQDAYFEALDLVVYLRQAIEERSS